ncbi:MAG: ribosome small subunit-dependent GTPase A [Polyangiaceae bacterium]
MTNLEDIGFGPDLEQALHRLGDPELVPGRVTRVDADVAQLLALAGERRARIPKRVIRADPGRPVTGDWVAVRPGRDDVVECVLDRRTELGRKAAGRREARQVLAANVDVLFVTMGLDRDFNLRRLERYLTLANDGGVRPVVLLTKAGLCEDPERMRAEAAQVAASIDVHYIDVLSGIAAAAPLRYLGRGITAALVGSSGAGKSTLVNHLLGAERMRTRGVREHDDRGKHTTTVRELLQLPCGGAIIDTPGLRELGLWADPTSLREAFPDIEALEGGCRFRDCAHRNEPGCAVRAAVVAGTLDGARLASYIALQDEIEGRARSSRRARR